MDLSLKNLQSLIWHKTRQNQTKNHGYVILEWIYPESIPVSVFQSVFTVLRTININNERKVNLKLE